MGTISFGGAGREDGAEDLLGRLCRDAAAFPAGVEVGEVAATCRDELVKLAEEGSQLDLDSWGERVLALSRLVQRKAREIVRQNSQEVDRGSDGGLFRDGQGKPGADGEGNRPGDGEAEVRASGGVPGGFEDGTGEEDLLESTELARRMESYRVLSLAAERVAELALEASKHVMRPALKPYLADVPACAPAQPYWEPLLPGDSGLPPLQENPPDAFDALFREKNPGGVFGRGRPACPNVARSADLASAQATCASSSASGGDPPRPVPPALFALRGAEKVRLDLGVLLDAYRACLLRRMPSRVEALPRPQVRLMVVLRRVLANISRLRTRFVTILDLLPRGSSRTDVVLTFLALLELARRKRVRLLEVSASRRGLLLVARR